MNGRGGGLHPAQCHEIRKSLTCTESRKLSRKMDIEGQELVF